MLVISFITFFLMYLSPGDPALIFLTQGGEPPDEATLEALREELGLNDSVWVQYSRWLVNLFHGDLGTSIFTGNPVIVEIKTYFPNTLKLTLLAMALTLAISIPIGVFAAVHSNKISDYKRNHFCQM